MARIMPRMPPKAVPQKKIAMMMVSGWRPVLSPMIRGVRKYPSSIWTATKIAKAIPARTGPPSGWNQAKGMTVASPIIVPK